MENTQQTTVLVDGREMEMRATGNTAIGEVAYEIQAPRAMYVLRNEEGGKLRFVNTAGTAGAEFAVIDGVVTQVKRGVRPDRKKPDELMVLQEELQQSFAEFQNDLLEQFRVKVRRERARQLRDLLSQHDAVDLVTFNREVWVFESRTRLAGEELRLTRVFDDELSAERLAELEACLDAGDLELHGNCIWGSGSKVFYPGLPDESERTRLVQQALQFLNDSTLTPLQKAGTIKQVKGFGDNIATGLVMIFHPTEFAIYNTPSRAVMGKLGYSVGDLQAFQEAARKMKHALNAADFIEQDWFLFQVNRGKYLPSLAEFDEIGPSSHVWKIAPYDTCWNWDECVIEGVLALGWNGLGDLSGISQAEFEARRNDLLQQHPTWKSGFDAVWKLRDLEEGDRLIAIQRDPRLVLGVGTVAGKYYYDPDAHFKHRWPVEWNSTTAQELKDQASIRVLAQANTGEIETYISAGNRPDGAEAKKWLDYIRLVLQEAAEPLHYREITQRVLARGMQHSGKTPENTVSYFLTRNPQLFERVQPGTYQLRKKALSPRVYKIAPGDDARYWDDCRQGGYICVGWDQLGDLGRFSSKEEYLAEADEILKDEHPHKPKRTEKANEVWILRELKPGDIIVANKGTSQIIGVGEVVEPLYQWHPERSDMKHTVAVRWRDDYAPKTIPAQGQWAFKTIQPVSPELYAIVVGKPAHVWLFQANANYYNLKTELAGIQVGDEDGWTVTRYKDQMQAGDTVLLWQSGEDAGIYALGEITGEPEYKKYGESPPDWIRHRDGDEAESWSVPFRYTQILPQPLLKISHLTEHPVLRNLQVIRSPQGTNFRVTAEEWAALQELLTLEHPVYQLPSFAEIQEAVYKSGLRIDDQMLRRYHLSLQTRGFVILAGISGTGKTWLTSVYAKAVGARHHLVPVAPNWTTNEDLLGYLNPITGHYHDTSFSAFLREAAAEYDRAQAAGRVARPYHLVLDEMNLARVEYYFAKFLSAMEMRARGEITLIDLAPDHQTRLTPNVFFVGTVNMDETTHVFADKVYDRSQLVELQITREALYAHLEDKPYRDLLMQLWDAVHSVAPFGFRILDEIQAYVAAAEEMGETWQTALDEQILQKVLPKLKGADHNVRLALERVVPLMRDQFPLSYAKAERMFQGAQYGFASYF